MMRNVGSLSAALMGALGLEDATATGQTRLSKKTRTSHRARAEKKQSSGRGPTGPTGPAGSGQGATGPTGEDGPPGPAGKSSGAFLGVTTVQAGVTVLPGVSAAVIATCPTVAANEQIIATAGGINAEAGSFMLAVSDRIAANAWRIIATNTGSSAARLGGYVVCVWFSR
ncbi:MAG: hypothetical protein U0075_14685 [Thermomicrobiales bacterium]